MIVANSSPVIILTKQGVFDLFKKCFQNLVIPKAVYDEVMLKENSPEAAALAKSIKQKWVIVQKTAIMPELHTKNIGQGEKEAISLAHKLKTLLIIDDDFAKKYATIFGVEAHGTFYVLYLACLRKLISKDDAKNIIDGMIIDGFYVSADLYVKFFELLGGI